MHYVSFQLTLFSFKVTFLNILGFLYNRRYCWSIVGYSCVYFKCFKNGCFKNAEKSYKFQIK